MMRRIREQLGSLPQVRSGATLHVSAQPIPADPAAQIRTIDQQVRDVADRISEMILTETGRKQGPAREEKNHGNGIVH